MSIHTIGNFFAIYETIAMAGQPTAEQLPDIARAGFRHVVNLATADHPKALGYDDIGAQAR